MDQIAEKSADSRERILDAAIREFGICGYDAASTNCVCRHADISKGLLFHYYRNKKQLFAAALERCICDLEGLDGICGTFDESSQSLLFFFASHPFHYRILEDFLHHAVIPDEKIASLWRRVVHFRRQRLSGFLEERPLRAGIDPEMALDLLLAATDYLQDKYLKSLRQEGAQPAELAAAFCRENHQVLSMLFDGIAAAPFCGVNGGTEC